MLCTGQQRTHKRTTIYYKGTAAERNRTEILEKKKINEKNGSLLNISFVTIGVWEKNVLGYRDLLKEHDLDEMCVIVK